MNLLYPVFRAGRLPYMLWTAVFGALVAGGYGIIHDQVSFAISPEYFTKMKFRQFAWADFGWPPRLFASEVGFLATWWVGLFAGWIVARVGLAELPKQKRHICTIKAFAIVLTVAPVFGMVGALIGAATTAGDNLNAWDDWRRLLDLEDARAFAIVAYLHAAGYLGAVAGLILAVVYVRRCVRRSRTPGDRDNAAVPIDQR